MPKASFVCYLTIFTCWNLGSNIKSNTRKPQLYYLFNKVKTASEDIQPSLSCDWHQDKRIVDQFICLLKLYPWKWSLEPKRKPKPKKHPNQTCKAGTELYWQEYSQFIQQCNTSAVYSVRCLLCAHFKNHLYAFQNCWLALKIRNN